MEYSCIHNHQSQFIEWFGDVEYIPLKNVCLRIGEYGSNTPATDYDGSVRYLRITDINDDGSLGNEIVSPSTIEEKYYLQTNDFVFARTGNTVGKTYLHTSGKMIYAGYLIRYKLDETCVLPKFLLAYTHTSLFWDWVSKMKKVGAQPNISAQQYNELPIPRAEIASQQRFVSIAEQADKSKFDGFKSQFIELIRDCQTYLSISDLSLNFLKGITPTYVESSCVEVINQACVTWDGIDFSNVKYQNSESSFAKGILNSDDLLLTMTGRGTLGRCNIFFPENDDITYIADSHISILRVNKTLVLPIIIAKFISLSDTQDEIYRNYVTGSTNQLDIVFSKIKNFKIPVPPMALQEEFAAIVSQADKSKYYEINETSYGIL